MPNDGVEEFLRIEEDAHRLVEELARLKEQADSYKTAREALDEATDGIGALATRMGAVAGELAAVVGALRTIGTPQLLQGQNELADQVASLGKELAAKHHSIAGGLARADAARSTLRKLVLGSVGISLLAVALIVWLVLSLPRA